MKEKQNLKEKKIIKNKGKHKKKVLRVLVYIVLITFVLSLMFLIGFGIYHLSTSPRYNITSVEFEGNIKYDKELLNDTIGDMLGKNLFKISKKEIKNNLNVLPYVQSIKVSRKLPSTLKIIITEYDSVYMAYDDEKNLYYRLTEDGIILEVAKGEEKLKEELLLFGLSFDDTIDLKDKIANTEIQKIQDFKKIKNEYDNSDINKEITSIEFKDGNCILTLDYDVNVILNTKDLDYNISFLKSILDELVGKTGTIDMTKTNPVFTESIK